MTNGIGYSYSLFKRIEKAVPDTIGTKDINRSSKENVCDFKMVVELAFSNTKNQNWIDFSKASILGAGNFQIGNDAYVSGVEDGQDIHAVHSSRPTGEINSFCLCQRPHLALCE